MHLLQGILNGRLNARIARVEVVVLGLLPTVEILLKYLSFCILHLMKTRLLLLAVGVVGFVAIMPSQSQAVYLPSVGPNLAESETRKLLRQNAFWRYRSIGDIDCRRGKIDRITWSCRITIIKGKRCQRGRSRVYSRYDAFEDAIYTSTRISMAPKYACVGV